MNNLLQEKGLIYEENGEMKWRAYLQCGGGAAYLHIRQGDEEAEQIALAVIGDHMRDESSGIEKLYARDELDYFHVGQTTKYMLEAKRDYCFDESMNEPTIVDLDKQGVKFATHGYSPDKDGYRCNLVVSGEKIRNGHPIGDIEMVDIAPTMAKILGIDFNPGDGRPLEEIFMD
ncbi:hypothetical protein [Paenibacillus odorifer]|uniref:hypothetical protein n=1 Tax=Paenibacillus odorifer TaxID=189426 RepID=UPI0020CCCA60|nr:hypothetical protein [Paenibacillus odorifer]